MSHASTAPGRATTGHGTALTDMSSGMQTITERTPVGLKHWKFTDCASTIGLSDDDAAAAYARHDFSSSLAFDEVEGSVATYSSDGKLFAIASAHKVEVYDATCEPYALRGSIVKNGASALYFSPELDVPRRVSEADLEWGDKRREEFNDLERQ